MNLKMILLQGLARIILGNDVFSTIKDIVINLLSDDEHTGEEKRKIAIKRLRALGIKLTDSLLNLGIEIALASLKSFAGGK